MSSTSTKPALHVYAGFLQAPFCMCCPCIFVLQGLNVSVQSAECRHESELAAACRSGEMDAAGQWTRFSVKDTAGTPTNWTSVVVVAECLLYPYPPLQPPSISCSHCQLPILKSRTQTSSFALCLLSHSIFYFHAIFLSLKFPFTLFLFTLPGVTPILLHLIFSPFHHHWVPFSSLTVSLVALLLSFYLCLFHSVALWCNCPHLSFVPTQLQHKTACFSPPCLSAYLFPAHYMCMCVSLQVTC